MITVLVICFWQLFVPKFFSSKLTLSQIEADESIWGQQTVEQQQWQTMLSNNGEQF